MAAKQQANVVFEKSLQEIHEQGIKWGMNEEDIRKCFSEALKSRKSGGKALKTWSIWLVMWYFMVGVLVVGLIVYYFTSLHEPSAQAFQKRMAPYNYNIFRALRLALLPLTKAFPKIHRYYDQECLIYSPLFEEDHPRCDPCSEVDKIETKSGQVTLPDTVEGIARPFVIRTGLLKAVSFDSLSDIYRENADGLDQGTGVFDSNNSSIDGLETLFTQHTGHHLTLSGHDLLHIEWITRRVVGAQVLRKVFPRPNFVPNNTEVSIERTVYIDGLLAKPYSMDVGQFTNGWYVQGSGHRRLHLVPYGCIEQCHQLWVDMNPRDILFYSDQFWRIDSIPLDIGTDVSISYRGSFY